MPPVAAGDERGVVWVVDDSPLEAEVAARLISAEHEVHLFRDGPTVLEHIASGTRPDLLVLDWHMPEMSGLEVCRFLRERHDHATLPILVLTATGGQEDIVSGLEAGANDFVVKISDPAELLARVRTLVRARVLHERVRRAEESAHRARQAAESANQAKDAFMAIVSHELRTPLSSILGWAHLLKENTPDEVTLRRGLETIERNAKIQVQMIEDILDTTRVVSGKLHLSLASVRLEDVLRTAVDSLKPATEAKQLQVEITVKGRLTQVNGDADRLQQAVWNLLSNAAKFTPQGGLIRAELESNASEVVLRIIDSGSGISADFLPYVFDRFRQQEATASRRYSGLGLGLALVRHIVLAHGGDVTAESEGENRGATFTLRLPLDDGVRPKRTESEVPSPVPPSTARAVPIGQLVNMRILVVEDDEDARELVVTVLRQQGATVTQAKNVEEALARLAESCPDLLVSDVGLPNADGYEFLHRVRERFSPERLPAIALTAYSRREDRRLALDAGFQAHLAKPAPPAELIRLITEVARNRTTTH